MKEKFLPFLNKIPSSNEPLIKEQFAYPLKDFHAGLKYLGFLLNPINIFSLIGFG
jgi:hypothetical protein